jgi:hypothetical protein
MRWAWRQRSEDVEEEREVAVEEVDQTVVGLKKNGC